MYEIVKVYFKIDKDDFIDRVREFTEDIYGYIDCDYSTYIDSFDIRVVASYDTLELALKNVDKVVNVEIDDSDIIYSYEYIKGYETITFDKAKFDNTIYPLSETMYSEDCFNDICNELGIEITISKMV